MKLEDLGFDRWFEAHRPENVKAGSSIARVTAVDRDRFIVRTEDGEASAEPAGRFRFSAETPMDYPTVGDWVYIQLHNDNTTAVIHALFPRKSYLTRKTSGAAIDTQLLAANLDAAFVMQSCDTDFNIRRLERYLVMINEGGIEPVIVFSKCDLIDPDELPAMIDAVRSAKIEARIIAMSNTSGVGLDEVRETLAPRKTYCLLGSSGVGKTSLINNLFGRDVLRTNEVRDYDGKGRHTTTRRQLMVLDNGSMLIDTPGMRELALIGADTGIRESFGDIEALSGDCRFKDCSHTVEAGCAVLRAIENGELDRERYNGYMRIAKESRYHEMSYVEKRKKDKAFGRFIKTAKKSIRRNSGKR